MMNEAAEKAVEAAAALTGNFHLDVFQHLIDHVHTFTGCSWWASIALTTILIRALQLPIMINQTKVYYKLTRMSPQVEKLEELAKEVMEERKKSGNEGSGEWRLKKQLREHGLKDNLGLSMIAGVVHVGFCVAIANMERNVESFKDGGALWFTDLTTPDAAFILPVLGAFTFFSAAKFHGAEYKLYGGKFIGATAALTVPLTAFISKGMLCYWITSNLYGLAYAMVVKNALVKKMLGVPNVAERPVGSLIQYVTAMPVSVNDWIPLTFIPIQFSIVVLRSLFNIDVPF